MNPSEFIDYVLKVKQQQGMTKDQALSSIDSLVESDIKASEDWKLYRESIKNGIAYAPIATDFKGLGAIALDMKRGGNVFAKYKITRIRGVNYVIFQRYSGLRTHLKGTRYLANNPKVVSFGIGKRGIANSLKQGFVLNILISAGFHATDQLMNDKRTWHDFVGGMAVDITVAAAASGIAWGLVATTIGTTATLVAIGPILALILVGALVTAAISWSFETDQLSETIAEGLRELEAKMIKNHRDFKHELRNVEKTLNQSPHIFIQKLFSIPNFDFLRN